MTMTGRAFLLAAISGLLAGPAFAQMSMAGKAFVAEVNGGITFIRDGAVVELHKGDSLPIQGARIETAAGASAIFVFSNGTSLYVDEKTIAEVLQFDQKPFPAGIDTTVVEPSVSNTLVRVTQGRVIITTNTLATGTSMVYRTPQAEVRIRGRQVVVQVDGLTTRVIVLRGDATVRAAGGAPGDVGQILHDGQMAVATSGSSAPASAAPIQVAAAEPALTAPLAPMLAASERAQHIVLFASVTTGEGANATTEIQARAVVPAVPPVELTVSPSTLRTGG
jgi:hypothetical protein